MDNSVCACENTEENRPDSKESPVERILEYISDYPKPNLPIHNLAKILEICSRSVISHAADEEIIASDNGKKSYITKREAVRLVEKNRAKLSGWESARELAKKHSINEKTTVYLLLHGRIKGEKDLTGIWRIDPSVEKSEIKKVVEGLTLGKITLNGTTYYSISQAANDAAFLFEKPGTQRFRIERNRLNKRFQRQVYDTEIGQIEFDGKYFVPESVYKAMINPATFKKGERTDFKVKRLILEEKIRSAKKKRNLTEKLDEAKNNLVEEPFLPQRGKIKKMKFAFPADFEYAEWIKPDYVIPPAPEPPKVIIITAKDYGIAEPTAVKSMPLPNALPRKEGFHSDEPITYDSRNPPGAQDCKKGRELIFYGRRGIIKKVFTHDKFRPTVRVYFEDEPEKDMKTQELLLKRNS